MAFDVVEILQALQGSSRASDLLSLVVERIAQSIAADRGSLWLDSRPGRGPQLAAAYGLKAELSSRWKREVLASRYEPLCRQVSVTGKPVFIPEAQTAMLGLDGPIGCFGDQSLLAVPVVAKGLSAGVMIFSCLTPGVAFGEEDGVNASILASQAALIALMPSSPPGRPQEQAEVPEPTPGATSQLASVVSESSSHEALVGELARLLAETVRASSCWVLTWDPRRQEFRVHIATSSAKLRVGSTIKPSKPVDAFAEKLSASGPFGEATEDLSAVLFPSGPRASLGTDLLCGAPLIAHRELVGVVLLGGEESPRQHLPASASAIVALLSSSLVGCRYLEGGQMEVGQLRAFLDSLPDGLLAASQDERVILFNRRAQELLGSRTSEVFGQQLSTVLSLLASGTTDPARFVSEVRAAIRQSEGTASMYAELAGPEPKRLLLRIFRAHSEAGQQLGWGVLVSEGQGSREGDQVRSDVFGGVSQELRTPLATIKGCTTTLLNSYVHWDEDTAREFVTIIDNECDRLHSLVENVFEASRIVSGSFTVHKQSCSVKTVVEGVLEEFKVSASRVALDLPDDLPRLVADPSRVGEVVRNLIDNAIKFSASDSAVSVRGRVVDGELRISVHDEGLGIAPEHWEKVFDRFYCVGSAASRSVEGIGLGLSIARSIVEAHKGRIWVESTPGKGSSFIFSLPLGSGVKSRPKRTTSATAKSPDRRDEPTTSRQRVGRITKRPSVLVVDDEPRTLRYIRANLESGGYKVLVASDGATAIRTAEAEEPDLILLDIMLPDLDGFEVCQRIRQFSVVPVIMITGRSDEADRVRGLNLGADDYLTKPFSPDELMARVGAVMRRTRFTDDIEPRPTLLCADLAINFAQRRVTLRGAEIKLSPTEYKLLYELAANAGRVLSHEDLLQRVWGPQYRSESAYLWTYIRHLRRKLEEKPDSPKYILTEPGVGYVFALPA